VVHGHPRHFPEHFTARVFSIESDCAIPSPVLDHILEEMRDLPVHIGRLIEVDVGEYRQVSYIEQTWAMGRRTVS
jgi:hypothetical protein